MYITNQEEGDKPFIEKPRESPKLQKEGLWNKKMLLKYCFLIITIRRINKQQQKKKNQKCWFIIIFILFLFVLFAKGVCTPFCFLLIQVSVASHLQYWMHKIGTILSVSVPMFLTSAIQATHCLVQHEEPARQMGNGTEWNRTAVCNIC